MALPSTQPNQFVPAAASTPMEQETNAGLQMEDIVQHIAPTGREGTGVDSRRTSFWLDEKLSLSARVEILFGILSQKIPGHELSSSLIEVICFFVENIDEEEPAAVTDFGRMVPAFTVLLPHPILGPWAARIMGSFYSKKRIVPDWILAAVLALHKSLTENNRDDLRPALTALLYRLQPLRPDMIPYNYFLAGKGYFPDYRQDFRDMVQAHPSQSQSAADKQATVIDPGHDFTYLQYQRKNFFGNSLHKKWYPAPALTNTRDFADFWTEIRFPDSPKCWLTDSTLLSAYLLTPRLRHISHEEQRLHNVTEYAFLESGLSVQSADAHVGRGEDDMASGMDVDTTATLLQRAVFVRDHIHENLPSVSKMVDRLLQDDTTSVQLIIAVLNELSIIYVGSFDNDWLVTTFDTIRKWFAKVSDDVQTTLQLLQAFGRMLDKMFEDCDRLLELEQIDSIPNREMVASRMFIHDETAMQALRCDSVACCEVCGKAIDAILVDIFGTAHNRADDLILWDAAVRIWEKTSFFSSVVKLFSRYFLPDRGLLKLGLLHRDELIRRRVTRVCDEYSLLSNGDFPDQVPFKELKVLRRKYGWNP